MYNVGTEKLLKQQLDHNGIQELTTRLLHMQSIFMFSTLWTVNPLRALFCIAEEF